MPKHRNDIKGDSNPCSFDCKSDILLLSYRALVCFHVTLYVNDVTSTAGSLNDFQSFTKISLVFVSHSIWPRSINFKYLSPFIPNPHQ